ncbi:MAG: PAS domain-containing protein, partial [Bradyrhizobium sp.]
MAGKNWQAGGGIMIPAGIVLCLAVSFWAVSVSGFGSSLVQYFEAAGPDVISDAVLGGLVIGSFLVAIGLWVVSTLRRFKRSQLRRNAFVSSALNNLKQGVVITNPRQRIVFLNDRYLEIYGLSRSDIT